jgi:ABC-type bacteriocin/lantibiotic exporter with double-glycine peptidase domain
MSCAARASLLLKKSLMPNKPRLHKQETKYSCAPACLLMVLDAFGISRTEAEIRHDSKCTRIGTDPDDLLAAARKYGFTASIKSYHLSFTQLRKQLQEGHYPIVYLLDTQEHSVVVCEIDRKGVHVLDPIRGERTIPRKLFEEQWGPMRRVTLVVS